MTTLTGLRTISFEVDFEQAQEITKQFLIECFDLEKNFDNDTEMLKAIKKVLKECMPTAEWLEVDKELVIEENFQA